MGLISNLLSPVTLHALRYGHAQDVAHLPRDQTAGFVDDSIRQSLSHAPTTLMRGTTEMYTGPHTREIYNDRAAAQYTNPWGAEFSEESALDAVKGAVSNDEIAEWQRLNEPDGTDPTTRNARERARAAIRVERHRRFIATAAPERKNTTKKGVLSEKSSNLMASRGSTKKSSSSQESPAPIRLAVDPVVEQRSSRSVEQLGNIDPRLLEVDDLNNIEVDTVQLEEFQSQVLLLGPDAEPGEADKDNDIIGLQALLDVDDDAAADHRHPPAGTDFVTHLSRINIVNCTRFADQWAKYEKGAAYEDSIGQYSVCGNSRDSPTPIRFQCQATAQCPYVSIQLKAVVAHEVICSPEYVARELYRKEQGENFRCALCDGAFLTQHLLNMHVKSVHSFTPVPCPEGCDPAHIYDSQKTLDAHHRREHSGIWPARCLYPGCTDETKFKSSSYSNHLTKAHGLTTRAARSPFFPPTLKRTWQPTVCDVDGCTNSHAFVVQSSLVKHLVKAHGYEEEDAKRASERGLSSQMSVETSEKHIMRKYRPKPWAVGRSEEDTRTDDDEAGTATPKKRRRA